MFDISDKTPNRESTSHLQRDALPYITTHGAFVSSDFLLHRYFKPGWDPHHKRPIFPNGPRLMFPILMITHSQCKVSCEGGLHGDVMKLKHFPRYWPFVRLNKQSQGWWFETPSRSLYRHCNAVLSCQCALLHLKKSSQSAEHTPVGFAFDRMPRFYA